MPFYFGNERFDQCPLKLITPLSWEYIKAFRFYQKGMLANGRGWNEECQKYLDAMAVIENEVNRREAEEMAKSQKKRR